MPRNIYLVGCRGHNGLTNPKNDQVAVHQRRFLRYCYLLGCGPTSSVRSIAKSIPSLDDQSYGNRHGSVEDA